VFYFLLGAAMAIDLALLPADFQGGKGVLWAENKVVDYQNGSLIGVTMPMVKRFISEKCKSKKKK
jgi:hypothetical protein